MEQQKRKSATVKDIQLVIKNKKREMKRDSVNGYLGGVCKGIADQLNVNVLGVRLIFLFFIPALIYVILWATLKDKNNPYDIKIDDDGTI